MATFRKDSLGKKGNHQTGQLNSWVVDTVINGAIVTEANGIDNFTLGEIHYPTGAEEAHVKQATANAKGYDMVLIATPEVRLEGEPLCNFYNGKDERATCVILKQNLTFQTSAFTAVGAAKVGDKAVWDATTKTFKKAESADLTSPEKVFLVTEIETDGFYSIDDKTLVQLKVLV